MLDTSSFHDGNGNHVISLQQNTHEGLHPMMSMSQFLCPRFQWNAEDVVGQALIATLDVTLGRHFTEPVARLGRPRKP